MSIKSTFLPVQTTLQSKGKLLCLESPVVMGILNATPDSFYNKGRKSSLSELVDNAGKMIEHGATILDIGGTTTKPGTALSDANMELERALPLIEILHQQFAETWLSIDTYHAIVAEKAVEAGVHIVNDVSSGTIDLNMLPTVARLGVPYIAMHMKGTPETMQQDPQYEDVVYEVRDYLRLKCDEAKSFGIKDIIIDPGFGFGKTVADNFKMLNKMHTFRILGKPVLAGLSRKSMIYKTLQTSAELALNGTTALNMIALQQGANILRVHDVKEAVETIQLFETLNANN